MSSSNLTAPFVPLVVASDPSPHESKPRLAFVVIFAVAAEAIPGALVSTAMFQEISSFLVKVTVSAFEVHSPVSITSSPSESSYA